MRQVLVRVASIASCALIAITWILVLASWLLGENTLGEHVGVVNQFSLILSIITFMIALVTAISEPNTLTKRILFASMIWPVIAALTLLVTARLAVAS